MMSLALTISLANSGRPKCGSVGRNHDVVEAQVHDDAVNAGNGEHIAIEPCSATGAAEIMQQPAAADALVDHREPWPRRKRIQPRRQQVGPRMVLPTVDPAPCVMESPSATSVPIDSEGNTSTIDR